VSRRRRHQLAQIASFVIAPCFQAFYDSLNETPLGSNNPFKSLCLSLKRCCGRNRDVLNRSGNTQAFDNKNSRHSASAPETLGASTDESSKDLLPERDSRPAGVTPEDFLNTPVLEQSPPIFGDGTKSCSICGDEMSSGTRVARLGCKHEFCYDCLGGQYANIPPKGRQKGSYCAICRTSISGTEIEKHLKTYSCTVCCDAPQSETADQVILPCKCSVHVGCLAWESNQLTEAGPFANRKSNCPKCRADVPHQVMTAIASKYLCTICCDKPGPTVWVKMKCGCKFHRACAEHFFEDDGEFPLRYLCCPNCENNVFDGFPHVKAVLNEKVVPPENVEEAWGSVNLNKLYDNAYYRLSEIKYEKDFSCTHLEG